MRLLTFHKILVTAALGLAVVMVVWGITQRREPGANLVLAVGAAVIVPAALYLRKLYKNPPIR
jgi:hypothetical protein